MPSPYNQMLPPLRSNSLSVLGVARDVLLLLSKGMQWDRKSAQGILTSYVCVLLAQSCLTLCNSVDCSLSGTSVHGILQARILEWVAITISV